MPASGHKELELSFIDQQPHIRVYNRSYIIFHFPDLKLADAATGALHTGFKEVLKQYPYLAGTVGMPDISSERLQVLYPDPINIDAETTRVFTTSFDAAHNGQFNYDKLARCSFLPEHLPASVFCPKLVKYHPGLDDGDHFGIQATSLRKGPLPAFATQASFIPNGLVLSLWLYHAVSDGAGTARILEVWSNAVQAMRYTTNPCFSVLNMPRSGKHPEDLLSARRSLAMQASHPCLPETQAVNRYPLRSKNDYEVVTKMFRFSSSAIKAFSETLSEAIGSHISCFSTLAAIIWAHILRARLPVMIASGNTQSALAIVVDLRRCMEARFSSPDYVGNLVLASISRWNVPRTERVAHADAVVPLRELVVGLDVDRRIDTSPIIPGPTPQEKDVKYLAAFASQISDTTHAVNQEWVTTQLSQVLTNPSTAQQAQLEYANGPDLYITSWMYMGTDTQWFIPGTSSSQASAMRRAAWVSEGGITVLPRKADRDGVVGAAYEVMISLAEADMEAFEKGVNDSGWLLMGNGNGWLRAAL
ncbi:trichothecene 3-o-acetyltransferase [Pyrenophora seminiperda CCB06]|uniref:Trichothecene 3-o-acetyltransferase n=1 Tax=Pyrenophora seminiperda CCB06 TaxID=1302712 RepID=A0A3M7M0V5_9PLEO|nr:trichothecene 3-o-acetyltransferase [Pyrenophora seminiperda CCB06]